MECRRYCLTGIYYYRRPRGRQLASQVKSTALYDHGSMEIVSVLSIGVPIAIMLVSDDPVVKENAKESINFHLNLWLMGILFGALYVVLIGFLLSPILVPVALLYNCAFPTWAVYKSLVEPNVAHRYPFIICLPL
jgi:uncharacterized protein